MVWQPTRGARRTRQRHAKDLKECQHENWQNHHCKCDIKSDVNHVDYHLVAISAAPAQTVAGTKSMHTNTTSYRAHPAG